MIGLLQDFLNIHWDRKSPLLLGYSGGPDSKALLYSLLECGMTPHIAHVDHGWRAESEREAKELEKEAKSLGCPFFTTCLNGEKSEDAARKGRFAFFQSLSKNYQAVLLAHQAEDLAETVLKRIFEGAHLSNLGGMEEISHHQDMTIWRPFLYTKKELILKFLQEKGLKAFQDSTNDDPKYLRARMRKEIFPFLNETFGKEITDNLTLFSRRVFELKKYLDQQIGDVEIESSSVCLNGLKKVEQLHLLQKFAARKTIVLSRAQIEIILEWVSQGKKKAKLSTHSQTIWVDQGCVYTSVNN